MSDIHDDVADFYRRAAADPKRVDSARADDDRWGLNHYDSDLIEDVPDGASELSMGCGNPFMLAALDEGEVVLDLGSGAGIDVILSAKRVGPTGRAFGLDFLDEMRAKAEANAAAANVDNIEFLAGHIEEVPLPDDFVDVVISNCVINLAPDKRPVFAEMARVLRPGGRIAISDVVVDRALMQGDDGPNARAECGSGGLAVDEYQALLGAAGFVEIDIAITHTVRTGLVRGRGDCLARCAILVTIKEGREYRTT